MEMGYIFCLLVAIAQVISNMNHQESWVILIYFEGYLYTKSQTYTLI